MGGSARCPAQHQGPSALMLFVAAQSMHGSAHPVLVLLRMQ